jgi:hypothetical protein
MTADTILAIDLGKYKNAMSSGNCPLGRSSRAAS